MRILLCIGLLWMPLLAWGQAASPQKPLILELDADHLVLLLTRGESLVAPIQPEIRGLVDGVELKFKANDPQVQQLVDRFLDDLDRVRKGQALLDDVRRNAPDGGNGSANQTANQNWGGSGGGAPSRGGGVTPLNERVDSLGNSNGPNRQSGNTSFATNEPFQTPPPRQPAGAGNSGMTPSQGGNSILQNQDSYPARRNDNTGVANRTGNPAFGNELPAFSTNNGLTNRSTEFRTGDFRDPSGNSFQNRTFTNPATGYPTSRTDNLAGMPTQDELIRRQEDYWDREAEWNRRNQLERLNSPDRFAATDTSGVRGNDTVGNTMLATLQDLQQQNLLLRELLTNARAGNTDSINGGFADRQASVQQVPTRPTGGLTASIEGPTGNQTAGLPTTALAQSDLEKIKSTNAVVWFMLLFSIGLNFYLAWLARTFYSRYADLADELRETFTASS